MIRLPGIGAAIILSALVVLTGCGGGRADDPPLVTCNLQTTPSGELVCVLPSSSTVIDCGGGITCGWAQ